MDQEAKFFGARPGKGFFLPRPHTLKIAFALLACGLVFFLVREFQAEQVRQEADVQFHKRIFELAANESLALQEDLAQLLRKTQHPGLTEDHKFEFYRGIQRYLEFNEAGPLFQELAPCAALVPTEKAQDFAALAGFLKKKWKSLPLQDAVEATSLVFRELKGDLTRFDKRSAEQIAHANIDITKALAVLVAAGLSENGTDELRKLIALCYEDRPTPKVKPTPENLNVEFERAVLREGGVKSGGGYSYSYKSCACVVAFGPSPGYGAVPADPRRLLLLQATAQGTSPYGKETFEQAIQYWKVTFGGFLEADDIETGVAAIESAWVNWNTKPKTLMTGDSAKGTGWGKRYEVEADIRHNYYEFAVRSAKPAIERLAR